MERRDFMIAAAAAAATGGIGAGQAVAAGSGSAKNPHNLAIQDGETVLFQGDSITDAGRKRDQSDSMGGGYPNLVSAWLSAGYPERNIKFLNRGISGNRVVDLQGRWKEDCLDLKPNWVSILIGVNDAWRRYDRNDPTAAAAYEVGYRDLLNQLLASGAPKLILMEPFLLHTKPEIDRIREDLDPKIEVVRKLALEFEAELLPLDVLFQAACEHRPPEFWARDGVHPTTAGHALIAQAYLGAVLSGSE